MKIVFLSVGEAFDKNFANTSVLIQVKSKILLDCGYSVPQIFWKYNTDPNFLDGIFISHFHADHYFGIPPLLLRMWEDGRNKPLTLIGRNSLKKQIFKLMEMGFRNLDEKLENIIRFLEVKNRIKFNELCFEVASSDHSVNNFAVKIFSDDKSVCYSGNGMFNDETISLYENSDLVIHECYTIDKRIRGHANLMDLINLSRMSNIKRLALLHLNRKARKEKEKIEQIIRQSGLSIFLPEPLETINI
ncbi:MAG: ribonuclease Z [Candidatus Bathyarchaeota archaeon]|nr:MAG: ribonuclease Z [Candidatus Bathyarchaeota archaeon]